ncbi:hypothetical protein TNCV_4101601 [Trichonephila clavipes]|nr:hypothetical protein TNCV_4101601 [Trichonephila clavipes]
MVTENEKWIVYKQVVRKKTYVYKGVTPPSTSKSGVHQKKIMLCCCRKHKGGSVSFLSSKETAVDDVRLTKVGDHMPILQKESRRYR